MAPPAVAIVIGVTAVVGITVAFHQVSKLSSLMLWTSPGPSKARPRPVNPSYDQVISLVLQY